MRDEEEPGGCSTTSRARPSSGTFSPQRPTRNTNGCSTFRCCIPAEPSHRTPCPGNNRGTPSWKATSGPLPSDAVAHPRSAGTFARFFARYVTGRRLIGLSDAVAKCTLIPAQILANSSSSIAGKGRLQVGADADIAVFDLESFEDRATFSEPTTPSAGMVHVLVGGTPLISSGILDTTARPGRAVRG